MTPDTADLSQLLLPIQPEDHVQGEPDARFTLVEYGDYQCPACGTLFATIEHLRARWPNEIRVVFRQYPLSGIHPRALEAAEAAEAAGAQGRFWEMHDTLFSNQNALSGKNLRRYAEQLALDVKRFSEDLKHRVYEERIRIDFRRGVANGVYGTPGLFVNGVRYNGPLDPDSLIAKAESVLTTDSA